MVDSLNYSYDYGELSNSQKEAIITLIEKKDKDKRHLSNWRPISLINVDAKIGLKIRAIAKRLENVMSPAPKQKFNSKIPRQKTPHKHILTLFYYCRRNGSDQGL